MRRPKNNNSHPEPPALPSFTVEASPEELPDPRERHLDTGLTRHDVSLDESQIDADAARVVRRLERSGFEAYLVGGCVRDLLLGGKPKDFDIATSARPEDVRALFRNCRIIGRRFRLAHVLFSGGKVVEVATFRRSPQVESPDEDGEIDDLLIRSDNVFGEAHEDALRRDFTINALFYDLDRAQVLDWCNGLEDVRARSIETIGDPGVRFREDPVRMLRAVKFAARLDLGIKPEVYDSMVQNRFELARAARPRLFEEILRLLRGGAAARSMWLLWEIGALAVLLPELSAFLDDEEATDGGAARFWKTLRALDAHTKAHGPLGDIQLSALLFQEALDEAMAGTRDPSGAALDFLESIVERVAMPRRIADGVRRIAMMVPKLLQGRIARLVRTELFDAALDVAEVSLHAQGASTAMIDTIRREHPPHARPVPVRVSAGGGGGGGGGGARRPSRARRSP